VDGGLIQIALLLGAVLGCLSAGGRRKEDKKTELLTERTFSWVKAASAAESCAV